MKTSLYQYLSDGVSFISSRATHLRRLYFPLCGTDAQGLKSSITPFLSGDIKIDKYHYLTKPVSVEDLRYPVRNFFVYVQGQGVFSLAVPTDKTETSSVEIGQLWHKLVRRHTTIGLEMEALNFIPVTGEAIELMKVTLKNIGKKNLKITPTAFVPIFGRALANKHDHEHVTSLFHRIRQLPWGVLVKPTMLFDEQGHSLNSHVYYVFGVTARGQRPVGTFPTIEHFCGEGGQWEGPRAVEENLKPSRLSSRHVNGREAAGALRFSDALLKPGESREYFLGIGMAAGEKEAVKTFQKFDSPDTWQPALTENKIFWSKKTSAIEFATGHPEFNAWLRWVSIQPILRRIFGNSFLPEHDYGKGGRGWRDLWQDLLPLIFMEPEKVREHLLNNFAGVRIDGSNATLVAASHGEFIADRNMITRVWMDHGAWPFLTTALYIHQTGDFDILFEEATYFRDMQLSRAREKDLLWHPAYGNKLKSKDGHIYRGTILEHLMVQNLVQFFNVGEHNRIRLENADWNDGLDTAPQRGESVAFTNFYGGNLLGLADLLEELAEKRSLRTLPLAREVTILLDTLGKKSCAYDSPEAKRELLFQNYFPSVQPELSGERVKVNVSDVVNDLRQKGHWIFEKIRRDEKISIRDQGKTFTWFNGYYDNKGRRVEGKKNGRVWMTLTGQVFSLMSGAAASEDIPSVIASVRKYLKDKRLGSYRLNTDFGMESYLDLGRAFGFAYGTKENGSFFNHMIVMYAYALYSRGWAREGFEVLRSIFKMCQDTDQSKIYPGIPEYFDPNGNGMYHYLTGSASWVIFTELTQAFGVRGEAGDLILSPQLVREEFDKRGEATVRCPFAGRRLTVIYQNPRRLDYGQYSFGNVRFNGRTVDFERLAPARIKIKRTTVETFSSSVVLQVTLQSPNEKS